MVEFTLMFFMELKLATTLVLLSQVMPQITVMIIGFKWVRLSRGSLLWFDNTQINQSPGQFDANLLKWKMIN